MNSVATRFVGIKICIGRALPKCCLREISKRYYFSKQLHWNTTGCSEQRFGSSIDIGGKECVVAPHPFSLVDHTIYKQSLASESMLRVEMAEAHFWSKKWEASFEE